MEIEIMQRILGLLVICVAVVLSSQVTLASVQVEIGNNGSPGNHWLLGSDWGTGSGQLNAVFKIDPSLPAQSFSLHQGQSKLLNFGSVQLKEDYIDPPSSGSNNETDNLQVTGYLFFDLPAINGVPNLANVVAFPGYVTDRNTDLKILFKPIYVNFDNSGKLKVELSDLYFKTKETLCVTACVTLVCEPCKTPEPATAVIWSLLGGFGLVFVWRKRKSR
jgi:hypothetical protein